MKYVTSDHHPKMATYIGDRVIYIHQGLMWYLVFSTALYIVCYPLKTPDVLYFRLVEVASASDGSSAT